MQSKKQQRDNAMKAATVAAEKEIKYSEVSAKVFSNPDSYKEVIESKRKLFINGFMACFKYLQKNSFE